MAMSPKVGFKKTGRFYVLELATTKTTVAKVKYGKKVGATADTSVEPEDPAQAAILAAKFATVRSIGEECVTEEDLRVLLKKKPDSFRLYDGFEPSGRMHIAQGIFKAINVNKCTSAGGTFVFWVADWFALMNDKMGGDLEKIKDVGQYFVEVWKAAGMDMSSGKVEFRWCSDNINRSADKYWPQMLDIARRFTLARIMKCCTIMGRAEGNLTAAQILYPVMQCTDIFFLRADICQLGVDQRKVNMLAREYCTAAGIKLKPVILSHHMLYGLKAGQAKMSKSDPDSAIFMEDTREDIERKMSKAYCPRTMDKVGGGGSCGVSGGGEVIATSEMRLIEDDLQNPCLDYVEHIVLSRPGATFTVPRSGQVFREFSAVRRAFLGGSLSEEDLKAGLVDAVDALVKPVRDHFSENPEARALFARVQKYKTQEKTCKEADSATTRGTETTPAPKPLRRLVYAGAGEVTGCVHLVVAPLPTTTSTSIGTVLTLLKRIRAVTTEGRVLLWLPDWSALVLNCFDGDPKAIHASFTLLVEALLALDKLTASTCHKKKMTDVEVVFQSDAILSDPSNYWISVINVGRQLKLNDVKLGYLHGADFGGDAVSGGSDEDTGPSEAAGCVVSALMHVADVLACAPVEILCDNDGRFSPPISSDKLLSSQPFPKDGATSGDTGPHLLALRYWEVAEVEKRNDISPPTLVACSVVSTRLSVPGGSDDEYVIGDDPQAGANKKMKRAFCEPRNVISNPPLNIARDVVVAFFGQIELGGHVYTSKNWADAEAAFGEDKLTPQILKPAVTSAMADVLNAINSHIKESPTAKKADKTLKAFIKKNSSSNSKKKR